MLVLTRRDVATLLDLSTCIAAVEEAFRLHGEGKTESPGVIGVHVEGGGFHVKAGALVLGRPYFAAKVNANFPTNPSRHALPTIQGVVVLADAERGTPLAVMDSMELTTLRTAAATAVAAKYLARLDTRTVTIAGCGTQGRAQLRAVLAVCKGVERVYAFDRDADTAAHYAREMSAELSLVVRPAPDLARAASESDLVVTCTPSRDPILDRGDVRPGTFIAAVGADNPEKHEIAPALLAASRVVADVVDQAATMGDLHHAIAAGVLARSDATSLGEVVAGRVPARGSPRETIVFDSTGMALQDVAAAAVVYERAVAAGHGLVVPLGDVNAALRV